MRVKEEGNDSDLCMMELVCVTRLSCFLVQVCGGIFFKVSVGAY